MKAWNAPRGFILQFAANDYVSACYNVYCATPRNNMKFHFIIDDTNGNGVYDAGSDTVVFNSKDYHASNINVWGCGGYHTVQIQGDLPTANGFAIKDNGTIVEPILWWNGSVVEPNPSIPGVNFKTFHVSDLTRPDAIIPATGDNANFS